MTAELSESVRERALLSLRDVLKGWERSLVIESTLSLADSNVFKFCTIIRPAFFMGLLSTSAIDAALHSTVDGTCHQRLVDLQHLGAHGKRSVLTQKVESVLF